MKKTFLSTVTLVSAIFSLTSYAIGSGTDEYVCDGCSDAQTEAFVKDKYGVGEYNAFVFDRDRGIVTKWEILVEREGGRIQKTAIQLTVDSSVSSGFDKYMDMYHGIPVYIQPDPVEIPVNLYGSAYDVVGDPNAYRDLVLFAYGDTNWFESSMDWAGSAFIDLFPFEPIIRFNFADGSFFEGKAHRWDITELDFDIEYYTAEDSSGNILTEEIGNFDPLFPIPGSAPFIFYIVNGDFTAVDEFGNQWTGGEPDKCYAISCATVTLVCNVVEVTCP